MKHAQQRSMVSYFHRAGHMSSTTNIPPIEMAEFAAECYVSSMQSELRAKGIEGVGISYTTSADGHAYIHVVAPCTQTQRIVSELYPAPVIGVHSKIGLDRRHSVEKITIHVSALPQGKTI